MPLVKTQEMALHRTYVRYAEKVAAAKRKVLEQNKVLKKMYDSRPRRSLNELREITRHLVLSSACTANMPYFQRGEQNLEMNAEYSHTGRGHGLEPPKLGKLSSTIPGLR